MYNRYLTAAQQHRQPEPPIGPPCREQCLHREQCPHREPCREQEAHREHTHPDPAAHVSGLLGSLSKRLTGFHLDADTLVVLAVIWFVLNDNDDDDMDTELLVAIGVLLLLGL